MRKLGWEKLEGIVEVYQVQAKVWSETKKLEEKTTKYMPTWPLACWRLGSQVFQDWLDQVAWKGKGREEVWLGRLVPTSSGQRE